MKLNIALFFASLLPLTACAVRPIVAPFYGDAGTQPVGQQETLEDEPTAYFSSSNLNAFTYCAWLKAEPTDDSLKMVGNVLAQGMVTIDPARATLEGGDGLTNLLPFDLTNRVPLDAEGEWSALCLPAVEDPTKGGGVFCVNIKCDKAVNLSIGDQSLTFAASDKMQIRNVWTSDANAANGRLVAVSTDPGATVYLGVAVNPIVHFYSVQTDANLDNTQDMADAGGGVSTNGYRFVVYRGLLDGTNLTLTVDRWVRAGKLPCARTNQTAATATHFARNARFRICYASACHNSWSKLRVRSFGARMYGEWIDDDLLILMRNKDWDEMVSRGIAYDSERGEAWGVTACTDSTPTSYGEEVAAADEATSLAYTTQTETRDIKKTVTLHAKSYLLDGFTVSDADMDWSCLTEGASFTQTSNVFTFASGGSYTLRGYNRKLGESREVTVNLSDDQNFLNYKLGDLTDAAKPYAAALCSVTSALASATLAPVVYNVNGQAKTANVASVKHIPSVPVYSSAGRRGNAAVSALSPHTWITAAHWYGVNPSTLEFTDGGSKTSTVRTDAGSFVFLRDWAKTNGFSDVDSQLVSDIAVGRFANDEAIDSAFVPYLMSAETATNAFGTAFAVPAWRSTQVGEGGAIPVLLEGGRDLAYVSGQSSAAESWTNEGSWASSSATNYARALAPRPLVESVQELAARKVDSSAALFPQTFGGDSGHPTYVNVGGETNVLVTQNYSIFGGDSDVAAADILKAWILTNGDEVKEFVYSAKPTARDYIQDGLVAMWDGIENAGWGKHDENATNWVDLVGGTIPQCVWSWNWWDKRAYAIGDVASWTSADTNYTAQAFWQGDSLAFTRYPTNDVTSQGLELGVTIGLSDYNKLEDVTIEVIMAAVAPTNKTGFIVRSLAGWYNCDANSGAASSMFRRNGCASGINDRWWDGQLVSFVQTWMSTNSMTWYYNGAVKNTLKNNTYTSQKLYLGAIFGQSAFKIQYYGSRIYNRVLTEEEIKHNYEIDVKRFGTAGDAAE